MKVAWDESLNWEPKDISPDTHKDTANFIQELGSFLLKRTMSFCLIFCNVLFAVPDLGKMN
jgi:hypothetical protein